MSVDSKTKVSIGLGTTSFDVIDTGAKLVEGKITLPTLSEGSPASSSLIVTMNLNGGPTFYTSLVGPDGFRSGTYAVTGDIINVILSSADPEDQQLNAIKSTMIFY